MTVQDQLDRGASGRSPTAPPSLWRDRNFVRLLSGETVSQLGSQITQYALPMTAVLLLGASAGQIGLLKTVFTVPYFIFPLAVGVLLDRRPRRPAMLVANAGRALLVMSIPVLAWLHLLSMSQLFVVAFVGGALSVVFDLAYSAYLPRLIGRSRLADANSKLQTGYSVAFLAGPGIAGLLVSAVGAASALVADAVSYVISLVNIATLNYREPPPEPGPRRHPLVEAREGVVALFTIPPVRQITLHATIFNGSVQLVEVAFVVYALRIHAIGPGLFGLVVTVGGVGGLLGALSGARLAKRFGFGPALIAAVVAESVTFFLLPAARGDRLTLTALFALTFCLAGAGTGAANVITATVRQACTPDRLMARVGAGYRMMNLGAVPVGAAVAGILVTAIGVPATLWVAPFGLMASMLPLVLTSYRRTRELATAES
jgi:MFS family permease